MLSILSKTITEVHEIYIKISVKRNRKMYNFTSILEKETTYNGDTGKTMTLSVQVLTIFKETKEHIVFSVADRQNNTERDRTPCIYKLTVSIRKKN